MNGIYEVQGAAMAEASKAPFMQDVFQRALAKSGTLWNRSHVMRHSVRQNTTLCVNNSIDYH